MTIKQDLWKFVSGCLASALLTGGASYMAFGSNAKADIAVIKQQDKTQDETLKKLSENEARILELLARSDERIRALEKR